LQTSFGMFAPGANIILSDVFIMQPCAPKGRRLARRKRLT